MNRLITIFAFVVLAASLPAVAQVNACSLLTPAEIESVLGIKLSGFGSGLPTGPTPTCSGIAKNHASVFVMFTPGQPNDPNWADPLGFLEDQSRASAKSINAQMGAKRFGSSIPCTRLIPLKQGPYSTQCMAVKKPTGMGSISVMVKTQQDMVPIDKLHLLAEKMLGRL